MASISIVVPSGADAVLLGRTLAALATQTRRPDEVLVVAESDAAAVLAREFGATAVEAPRGTPGLRAGFDAATGDVLARLLPGTVPGRHWVAQLEVDFDSDDTVALVAGAPATARRPVARAVLRSMALGAISRGAFTIAGHPALLGPGFGVRADAWRRMRAHLHADRADLDPAFDLAFQVAPDMRVLLDRTLALRVPPTADLVRFVQRAVRTIDVNRRERSALRRRWARYAVAPRPTLEIVGTQRLVEEVEHVAGGLVWGRLVRRIRSTRRAAAPAEVEAGSQAA